MSVENRSVTQEEMLSLSSQNDPQQLFAVFRNSPEYQEALKKFYEGKTVSPSVSSERKQAVFEESESAKTVLVDIGQDTGFSYDPSFYSSEVNQKIQAYIDHVKQIRERMGIGTSADEIVELDFARTIKHTSVGEALERSGVVPNRVLGRTLGRIFLAKDGLDTYESAKEPYLEAVKRSKS